METTSNELQLNGNIIGEVLDSISTRNAEKLVTELSRVNDYLTGEHLAHFKNEDTLKEAVGNFFSTVEKNGYADTLIYLGNGGYSKLALSVDEDGQPYFELDYEPIQGWLSEQVKQRWDVLKNDYDKQLSVKSKL